MKESFLNAEFDVSDKTKFIWIQNGKEIYALDIKNSLEELGIRKGDIVMGHFDLQVFGKIGNIKNRDEFYNIIINAIVSVVGNEGALIIPSFSYSLCNNKIFDIKNTKPLVGYFAEVAFKRYKENLELNLGLPIFRSDDPIFSCIGFGDKAELIFKDLGTFCLGDNSVFCRLYKHNAKLICFGFPFAVTYMHFVERCYNDLIKPIIYRFNKVFKGKVIDEKNNVKYVEYTYFVRDLIYVNYDFSIVAKKLESRLLLKKVNVGAGVITMATARDVYNTIFDMLDKDMFCLLSNDSKKAFIKYLKGLGDI